MLHEDTKQHNLWRYMCPYEDIILETCGVHVALLKTQIMFQVTA